MRRPVVRIRHRVFHTSGEILARAGESAPHFKVCLSFREIGFEARSVAEDTILDSRIWQFIEPNGALPRGVNSQAVIFLGDSILGNRLVRVHEDANCLRLVRSRWPGGLGIFLCNLEHFFVPPGNGDGSEIHGLARACSMKYVRTWSEPNLVDTGSPDGHVITVDADIDGGIAYLQDQGAVARAY